MGKRRRDESKASAPHNPEQPAEAEALANASSNELRVGRHLASSDKEVRDEALTKMRQWLAARSEGGQLTDLDLLKVWRGLWYSMFMCDKLPVQLDLAQKIGRFVHLFHSDQKDALRFVRSFFATMCRDWPSLDKHRLDKFYSFVRLFLRESLRMCCGGGDPEPPASAEPEDKGAPVAKRRKKKKAANSAASGGEPLTRESRATGKAEEGVAGGARAAGKAKEWDAACLESVVSVVEEEVLRHKPNGLRMHLADIFIDELVTVSTESKARLSTEAALAAMQPWLRVLCLAGDEAFVSRSFDRVLYRVFGILSSRGSDAGDGLESVERAALADVDAVALQAAVFETAAWPQARSRWRPKFYALHKELEKLTGERGTGGLRNAGGFLQSGTPIAAAEGDEKTTAVMGKRSAAAMEAPINGGSKLPGMRQKGESEGKRKGPAAQGWVAAAISRGEIASGDGESGVNAGKGTKKQSAASDRRRSGDEKENEGADAGSGDLSSSIDASKASAAPAGKVSIETRSAKAPGKAPAASTRKAKKVPPAQAARGGGSAAGSAAAAPAHAAVEGGAAVAAAAHTTPIAKPQPGGRATQLSARTKPAMRDVVTDLKAAEPSVVAVAPASSKRRVTRSTAVTPGASSAGEEASRQPAAAPNSAKAVKKDAAKRNVGATVVKGGEMAAVEATPKPKRARGAKLAKAPPAAPTAAQRTLEPALAVAEEKTAKKRSATAPAAATAVAVAKTPEGHRPPTRGTKSTGALREKKKVTFGPSEAKGYRESVKDMRRSATSPGESPGTPSRGVLRVKSPVVVKTAPRPRRKKASDYF